VSEDDIAPGPSEEIVPREGRASAGGGQATGTSRDPATVVVQFRPDLVATWLRSGTAPDLLAGLGDQIAASGFQLTQTHRGTEDADLASWFSFQTQELDGARRILAVLQRHPAVVAAFLKPPEAPPG
jgi:hypothetical protein